MYCIMSPKNCCDIFNLSLSLPTHRIFFPHPFFDAFLTKKTTLLKTKSPNAKYALLFKPVRMNAPDISHQCQPRKINSLIYYMGKQVKCWSISKNWTASTSSSSYNKIYCTYWWVILSLSPPTHYFWVSQRRYELSSKIRFDKLMRAVIADWTWRTAVWSLSKCGHPCSQTASSSCGPLRKHKGTHFVDSVKQYCGYWIWWQWGAKHKTSSGK